MTNLNSYNPRPEVRQTIAPSGLRRSRRISERISSSSTSPLLSAPGPSTAPIFSPSTPRRSSAARSHLHPPPDVLSALLSHSTPTHRKASGTDRFAFKLQGQLAREQYIKLAREMSLQSIGPMPIKTWISEFTSACPPRPPGMQMNIDVPPNLSEEDGWAYIINKINICPSLYVRNTCDRGGKYHTEIRKPDASGLLAHLRSLQDSPNELAKALWPGMELPIEGKPEDGWQDPPPGEGVCRETFAFERTTEEALAIRGQLISYALAMFTSQYRTFAFVVLIMKEHARLIRFDRAGAVVSEKFKWRVADSPLAGFLWRFEHMSYRERGHDTTVWIPSAEEVAKARIAFSTCKIVKVDLDVERPHKFHVYDEATRTRRAYMASSPRCYSQSLAGRGTFGYVAVDLITGDVVWIKDTWRVFLPEFPSEGEVYARLKKANVPYIANALRSGDVLCVPAHDDIQPHTTNPVEPSVASIRSGASGADSTDQHSRIQTTNNQGYDLDVTQGWTYEFQSTLTQEYIYEVWVCGPRNHYVKRIKQLRHGRLVLDTVARSLTTFVETKELATAVRDAAEAHEVAYVRTGTLHRDMSVSNILITIDGHGMLVDWDFSIQTSNPSTQPTVPRQFFKTGTWQFVSGLLLNDNDKALHKYHHDQESIALVLTYCIARYRPTNIRDLVGTMELVFDEPNAQHVEGGHHLGGQGKKSLFGSTYISPVEIRGSLPKPCFSLIQALRGVFWDGYYEEASKGKRGQKLKAEARAKLATPGWLVQCFDRFLGRRGWPSGDGSIDQVQVLRKAGMHDTNKRKLPPVYDADSSGQAVPKLPMVHTVARVHTAPAAFPPNKRPRLEENESPEYAA
ncbi:hypothetical protein OF83DRAFT_1261614 [Amylostereum chailletii]|nr:hypothetical protein OF83DRAFT_1261614 [Amylostereum chailletii]